MGTGCHTFAVADSANFARWPPSVPGAMQVGGGLVAVSQAWRDRSTKRQPQGVQAHVEAVQVPVVRDLERQVSDRWVTGPTARV